MYRLLRVFVCAGSLLSGLILLAQEPATIDSEPAVRFAQGNGYFHYAAFCRTPKDASAQMPKAGLPMDQIEFGIGWYVRASVMRGSGGASPEVDGRMIISPHHVRFMPANPQLADQYVDLVRTDTALKHSPGQSEASLQGKDTVVSFRFRKICPTCASGAPAPAGENKVLLEQEFALLEDTLAHFESGWRKTYRLSKGDSAEVASSNQPAAPPRPAAQPKAASAVSSGAPPAVSVAPAAAARPTAPPALSSPSEAGSNPLSASVVKSPGPAQLGTPKGRPVKIAPGAAAGLIVKKVPPQYPLEAKLVRLEGTVVVRAVIDRTGEVSEVNALSGPPLLESAAVEAVKQWQYKPYAVNGQPVDVETTIEVVFALDRQTTQRALTAHKQGGGQ